MITFGERLKHLRTKQRWTQDHLADRLDVTKQAISSWERNVSSPSNKQLIQLAELFFVTTDYLLGRPFDQVNFRIESYDLEEILFSHEPIHLGNYKLSASDKFMAIDILKRIFYEFAELRQSNVIKKQNSHDN